jgi:3-deoxy-7-phosphoheptulonate synthase
MLLVLRKKIDKPELDKLLHSLQQSGVEYSHIERGEKPVIKLTDEIDFLLKEKLENLPGVSRVINEDYPYHLASRNFKSEDTVVRLGDLDIGGPNPVIIAGPCAVEYEEQLMSTARLVYSKGIHLMRGGAFKPRTSPYSFAGLGLAGLQILAKAREEIGVRIITEVLDAGDVDVVSQYSDVLQVGSRNMQNYKLLKAVGKIQKPVMLKRGMSARLDEFLASAEHILSEGNDQVILCERGIRTFVEYSRNTLDLNIVPTLKEISHLPVIVDPSHGTGKRKLVSPMSMAALAAGADGIMIEVHPEPDKAWSDAAQALGPEEFSLLMDKIYDYLEWQKHYANPEPAT